MPPIQMRGRSIEGFLMKNEKTDFKSEFFRFLVLTGKFKKWWMLPKNKHNIRKEHGPKL